MGINTPTKICDEMEMLAEVEIEVLDILHADAVPLTVETAAWFHKDASEGIKKTLFCGLPVYFPPDTHITEDKNGNWLLHNASGEAFAIMPKDGFYFDHLLAATSGKKIEPKAFQPEDTVSDEDLDLLASHGRYLFENTDKAIVGDGESLCLMSISDLKATNISQGSLDEWMYMLMLEKETANEMMGRYADAVISCLKLYREAAGDYCFAWRIAVDDAGTQKAGLISPDLFNEMIKPHYKRVCDWVHEKTRWKTLIHSCGSVYHYIPAWIEAGVDIFNPVQISAANMEPERLMNDFSGKIVFWGGGCDTQNVLPKGTPEEVREHVEQNIKVFSSGSGGYVFTQVHNIQQDVPVENVEAMYEAAYEYGKYLEIHD